MNAGSPKLRCIFFPLFLLCLAFAVFRAAAQPAPDTLPPQEDEMQLQGRSGKVLSFSSQSFLLLDEENHARSFPLPEGEAKKIEVGCRVDLYYRENKGETEILQMHISPLTPLDRVQQQMTALSTEEKVGQLILARCPEQGGTAWVEQLQLGGYILFDRDFREHSPEEVKADISAYQQAAKIPLFIAVDEEGGLVTRASSYSAFRETPFASPQKLYAQGGWEAIAADTREKCAFLLEIGINLNLAPVADVSTDPDDFIYSRSFGQDGEQTAKYVSTVVKIMQEESLGSALKHFPGYGGNTDTHEGAAYDQRPYAHFLEQDFLPFRAGIAAGASMVMVSHNTILCQDPQHPASLSPEVLSVLRNELGYRGIIISDDLAMPAAADWQGEQPPAVQAILAGCDMLCSSDFIGQYRQLLSAVEQGIISQERLNASVERVLLAKYALGLLE
ncbi:MAG: glycoside hydrolase family 3 N-terminal domain-containing protein [Bacillota bacterium]|nr:glycoside hydrolase family 3 N-terminal domain-containing protein [Bacillota bacterium]